MLDKFSTTVEKIYAAAVGEEQWQEALHSIEDLTGSVGAVIGFIPKDPWNSSFNLAGRFTEEQCATYSQLYQPICRRTQYMIEHPHEDAVYDALLITEQEMNSDPVYDWFGQHGLRYFVGSSLPQTALHYAVFSLQRSPAQGHVQPADLHLFKRIRAHLGRALTLWDSLGSLRSLQSLNTSLFEALPHAVFALDGHGHITYANEAAAELLRNDDGLSIADGRLQVALSSEQATLDHLLASAVDGDSDASSGWTRLARRNGKPSYAVFVAPLGVADSFAGTAKALAIVHDPCARRFVDPHMLASLYGLTDTEARLTSAIAAGHSLETAAALLHMRVATARSHLKAIFAKLGVNRQQDLVQLLTSLGSMKI